MFEQVVDRTALMLLHTCHVSIQAEPHTYAPPTPAMVMDSRFLECLDDSVTWCVSVWATQPTSFAKRIAEFGCPQ